MAILTTDRNKSRFLSGQLDNVVYIFNLRGSKKLNSSAWCISTIPQYLFNYSGVIIRDLWSFSKLDP